MPTYFTPGVYFETLDSGAPRIEPLRTDIAAFIGVAERGPVDTPLRCESIEQFRSAFGDLIENALLPYSVKAFFENDGRTCYIVRVAAPVAECDAVGPQAADRLSSAVTSTDGFAAGAAVTITQQVGTVTSGAQPPDRASSVVAAVDGFAQGSLVRFVQGANPATFRHIAAVDAAAKRLFWDQPVDASYNLALPIALATTHQFDRLIDSIAGTTITWTRALDDVLVLASPIHFASGAERASFTLVDDTATPTLKVGASSAGRWGDHVTVLVTRTNRYATRTSRAAQPADRLSSIVESVVGFGAGTVVRLFQPLTPVAATADVVIRTVDPASRRILWTGALPAAFDLLAANDPLDPRPISIESAEFTLSVYENGRIRETFETLSMVAANADHYAPAVVNAASTLIRLTDLASGSPAPHNFPDPLSPSLERGRARLTGGRDGIAALKLADFTGDRGADERRGLRTLELVRDVSAIACPDILIERIPPVEFIPEPKPELDPCDPCAVAPPLIAEPPLPLLEEQTATFTLEQIFAVQQAIVEHCERQRDRIAIIDPPNFSSADLAEIESWRRRFDSKYAAIYYPWVVVYDPKRRRGELVRPIPPSGHVLGIYARSDRATGVHKAPANEELQWAQDLTIEVTPERQALLNPIGINALRPFAARGLRVYGARTMSSESEWRYVNVRRLFIMIERALDRSLQWAVFEPHDVHLREKISLSISTFLTYLWRSGALAGDAPEEAFYIRCNASNNPPDDVADGRLLAEVGIAPVIPAEFVVLRIGRVEDALDVTESQEVLAWQ